jgi:hypothetical protein
MKKCYFPIFACILFLFSIGFVSKAESKTITGTLYYRSSLMSDLTDALPEFWFKDRVTGQYLYLTANYNPADSTYEILECPETEKFFVDVAFPGEFGSQTTLAKSYRKQITFDTTVVSNQDIELQQIIHLVSPWNNGQVEFSTYPYSPYSIHYSPVQFTWEAVSGANDYEIRIDKYRDPDHPNGYGFIETILNENTSNTSFSQILSPSPSFEHYEFAVIAYEDEKVLGYYMTTYINGSGRDYRFKISDWPEECSSSLATESQWFEIQDIPDETGKVIIRAAFRNKDASEQDLSFTPETFQLWGYDLDENYQDIPASLIKTVEEPDGVYIYNETFAYHIEVNLSNLPSITKLGFRVNTVEKGAMEPGEVPLYDSCIIFQNKLKTMLWVYGLLLDS